jgi:hypothetical protein
MRVYVAGPISRGDQFRNVTMAIAAAQCLLDAGHAPYVPHLNYSWHMMYPGTWETWLKLDEAYLSVCNALVRLPGESVGADREVNYAHSLDIPVFHGVNEFLAHERMVNATLKYIQERP